MEYFDSHCHYDDEKFNQDREEILDSIVKEGVTKIISAGYSLEGSIKNLELSKKYNFIYTTIGISPNDINENFKEELEEEENLIEKEYNVEKNKKIVAIGEIGLDYHYNENKSIQKEVFINQINLANKYNLPIVIHTREAVMDTIEIIKNHVVNRRGVFHCCPFNRELVKEALKLGYYISFSGTCTFKNAKNAEEIVKMVPDDRFFIETDAPYLAPEPVRGKRNDSRNLKYIVKKIAEFKSETEEEIARKSFENTMKFYEIKA